MQCGHVRVSRILGDMRDGERDRLRCERAVAQPECGGGVSEREQRRAQLRAGFVQVSEARSDWAPDPNNPLPKFSSPRRVPHGVTLLGRLFDDGTVARAGLALEREWGVAGERPPGF